MLNYLNTFMSKCAFPEEDREILCNAYRNIQSNPSASGKLLEILNLYEESIHCDYKRILELSKQIAAECELHPYTTDLLVFLCLLPQTERAYESKGFSKELFYHTMADLRYKLEECRIVKGICGSFVASWFPGFFELNRFTLGRLQFEILNFGFSYERNGVLLTPDTKVLNVHIPRDGTRLDRDRCLESFSMAKEFFKDQYGFIPAAKCHSWLLFPKNKELLSEHSNTVQFMELFDIFDWHYTLEKDDLWRFFDTDEQNPNRLPTDTHLRQVYVAYLKQGGRTGCGYGVRLL